MSAGLLSVKMIIEDKHNVSYISYHGNTVAISISHILTDCVVKVNAYLLDGEIESNST